VLAELARRDLVPELWIPSLDDRALRERLRRRMHLVRMRASAMNRIFGLKTQWGLRISLQRLRAPDAMTLLERQGVPAVWRRSIVEALEVIDLLDARCGRRPGTHGETSASWQRSSPGAPLRSPARC
jgi:transposase